MLGFSPKTALLIIDVQNGFDDPIYWGGNRNNPQMENQIAMLLAHWRKMQYPIFHIQHDSILPHSPLHPNQVGNTFKSEVAPLASEPIIHKSVNSAFIGTDLEERLRLVGIDSLLITGLTTDHCVSTTTRMAGNLGFTTFVASDGTATFDRKNYDGKVYPAELVHELALASLHDEFATILTTAQILAAV